MNNKTTIKGHVDMSPIVTVGIVILLALLIRILRHKRVLSALVALPASLSACVAHSLDGVSDLPPSNPTLSSSSSSSSSSSFSSSPICSSSSPC